MFAATSPCDKKRGVILFPITSFMYIAGHKPNPVSLRIEPPDNWHAVNGRTTSADQREWHFPNYDVMIDTPTEIGPDWTMEEFRVDGIVYRVVVHSLGNENGKRAALVRDIEKIVRVETAMWGAPDFESYTFLIHFAADNRSGDGMEHLTSTQIIEPGVLADQAAYEGALETAAHEFFHLWNVKRLRPVELGPWDLTRPLSTRSLWIAEGLTNYYGAMTMRRAGLWNNQRLYDALAETITVVENAPGSRMMSAEEASTLAPLLDRTPHAQEHNLESTSISYYIKGEVLGLVLDLLVRGATDSRQSLDDVMRKMYDSFYLNSPNDSYYLKGRGYTVEDFERVTTQTANNRLQDFFARYVRGVETPPYAEALSRVGLRLTGEPLNDFKHNLGISLANGSMRVRSVRPGSPAEEAGIERGDTILTVAEKDMSSRGWIETLGKAKPGENVAITL
ncbi:MAG: PDZ domain-containing protein [Pyrinomonadaceae bacterium]